METDQNEATGVSNAGGDEQQTPAASEESTPQSKESVVSDKEKLLARKVTLSYEKYRRIANTLILFMRQEEDKITSSKC